MNAIVAEGQAELSVQLAIGRPGIGGRWDHSLWDQAVWTSGDQPLGEWVDVSCQVIDGIELAAGSSTADGVVTRWESATCAFALVGPQWNPWTGPYAGIVGPNMGVRVLWRPLPAGGAWLTVFTGSTDDDGYTWTPAREDHPEHDQAALAATDDTALLVNFTGPPLPAPVGQGETAAARVGRILNAARWPAERRAITGPGVAVKETALDSDAWSLLLLTADTDLALLYLDRDGYLTYASSGRIHPPIPLPIVLDKCAGPGVVQVVDLAGQQPRVVRNSVTIARAARDNQTPADVPIPYTAEDASSESRFRVHRYSRVDLIHTVDSWSVTVANAVLAGAAWPTPAPAVVALNSRLRDPAAIALLLGIEPGDAITVDTDDARWTMQPIGWNVSVSRAQIAGTVDLLDVTGLSGGRWDHARWNRDVWSV